MCKFKRGGLVGDLGGEEFEFVLCLLLATAQRRHATAQFIEREQLLLVGGEQPLLTCARLRQFTRERLAATLCHCGMARGFQPSIEFGLNKRRVSIKRAISPHTS